MEGGVEGKEGLVSSGDKEGKVMKVVLWGFCWLQPYCSS